MNTLVKILERKFGVIIQKSKESDGEYYIAYYNVHGRTGKEVCREKDLYELQTTLKLYLS